MASDDLLLRARRLLRHVMVDVKIRTPRGPGHFNALPGLVDFVHVMELVDLPPGRAY